MSEDTRKYTGASKQKESADNPSVILLLMMGGSGTRFGAEIPKQFVPVADKPVFSYIIEKYSTCTCVDRAVIVCHQEWVEYTRNWVKSLGLTLPIEVVVGGVSRSESVRNGLTAVARDALLTDVILIHDATHPYVDELALDALIEATREAGGATMGELQYDTVYRKDPDTDIVCEAIPRESIVVGASPEAFTFGRIWSIYSQLTDAELEKYTSAGALALAFGIPLRVIPTPLINLKITYRHDMEVFKHLFHDYYF